MDLDRLSEIWNTISRNKMRSLLTAFGVFWGIFMLVILSGTGNGFQQGIMENVKGVATNSCFFWANRTSEAYKGFQKGRFWSMRTSDIPLLKEKIPEAKYILPMLSNYYFGSNNVFFEDKGGNYSVSGAYPEQNSVVPNKMIYGRYINQLDLENNRKVCIIGNKVYEEMIGAGKNPLGKLLKVNGIYYSIIGVTKPLSSVSMGSNPSETVTLPFSTMQRAYNMGDKFYELIVVANNDTPIEKIEENIKQILKQRYDISPTDQTALWSFNVGKEFKMVDYLFLGINILIWIVGFGTLLSGIVGVSNIMLVTVRERTKEIGVRRALGAKPRVIITQILSESLLLTSLAGIIGFCMGVGILAIIGSTMGTEGASEVGQSFFAPPQISFPTAIAALVVLTLAGLAAGFIPAKRALQIKAIDAIREE